LQDAWCWNLAPAEASGSFITQERERKLTNLPLRADQVIDAEQTTEIDPAIFHVG
jgi:hypothetical protein